jgi:signal transduction histidine kinase
LSIIPVTPARSAVTLDTIESGEGIWLVAVAPLPDGDVRIVIAAPVALVVESANDLVRAFLLAILAAALLAVVAALWLSARISRPMLDLADEAERVKADFLASVSHELRTPLTPIRGYTEILRRGRVPARDASGYLDEIGLAAQRLERVVALLLDVASIEAGRFRIDVDDVDASDLLNEAEARWRGRARRDQIRVNVAASLPKVAADPDAIARVLDELLDNAMKFAPSGRVELSAQAADAGVEISVRDEGPGIAGERVEALREAFRQADTGDTRRFGGLGLGLTFAEGVLAAHGARLEIDSVPDEGTTCSFTLAAASSVTPMPSTRATARTSRAAKAASRKR